MAFGAVYRCTQDGMPVLYAQMGCPQGSREERVNPDEITVVDMPGLSAQEQQALAQLEQTLSTRRSSRQQHNQRQRRAAAAQRDAARTLCQKATTALDALKIRKRQGYSARESHKLDEEERRWQQARRDNC